MSVTENVILSVSEKQFPPPTTLQEVSVPMSMADIIGESTVSTLA